MDVENLNAPAGRSAAAANGPPPPPDHRKNKHKKSVCTASMSQFSIETYFIWFSTLVFLTEIIVDVWVATLYFHRDKSTWGLMTMGIIVGPLALCQIYSLWLLRTDNGHSVPATALCMHVLLMGIPYRYHNILRKVEKDKVVNEEWDLIKQRIRDVNAIQTVNAIFQYCPQFLFQSFLIVYRKYKCVITGVSAGLAGFSFLWHVFIHFYYFIKRYNADDNDFERFPSTSGVSTRIIDNLSTSFIENNRHLSGQMTGTVATGGNNSAGPSSIISNNLSQTSVSLTDSLRNFEKPMYKTDDKNFMSKKPSSTKSVEKNKIFGFNKRKPIYEREDFDLYESANISTVFFEIDDSLATTTAAAAAVTPSAVGPSNNYKEFDTFLNENINCNNTLSSFGIASKKGDFKYKFNGSSDTVGCGGYAGGGDEDVMHEKMLQKQCSGATSGSAAAIASTSCSSTPENRNSLLKRKGICSSQEMLHLVDIMNDHISPEQVDVLAKSLVELGGDVSLQPESEDGVIGGVGDPDKLLEQFPDMIADHRLLENIDAAIYENQIIFQERIRKNQLTIQNLKLQDQLLSKCIEDMKSPAGTELLSIRDYENMCFTNISRQNRGMKHWRNYLNDIDTSNHDASTVQHSSYYVNTNTMTNSLTDLYINEEESGGGGVGQDDDHDDDDDDDDDDENASSTVMMIGGDDHDHEQTESKIRNENNVIVDVVKKKNKQKQSKRWQQPHRKVEQQQYCDDETVVSEDLYISMGDDATGEDSGDGGARALPEKNILVETINKINVDSPIKSLISSGTAHKSSQSLDKI